MNVFTLVILAAFAALLVFAKGALPTRGDPTAPSNVHVSAQYLERSYEDTRIPNVVTSVLADYRSYDTLGEVIVIFAAGMSAVLILGRGYYR